MEILRDRWARGTAPGPEINAQADGFRKTFLDTFIIRV